MAPPTPDYKPGWFTTIGGIAGALAPAVCSDLKPIAAQVSVGATILGVGLDAAAGKLREDHRRSMLHSWAALEAGRAAIVQRAIRTELARADDPRLEGRGHFRDLKRFLAASRCWDGAPLPESIATLRRFGP